MDVKRQLDVFVLQIFLTILPLIVPDLRLIRADAFRILKRLLNALVTLFLPESLSKKI